MWTDLPNNQKQNYQKLITNFASLSEAFAQKEEDDDSIVAPIVNSKFQETAFQRCFNAFAEDIANTSYDASIDAGSKKYLIGIKTFGLKSGDQKIAQFKSIAGSPEWARLIDEMQANARGMSTRKEINEINYDLYLDLARKISYVRNERIESSKQTLRGFKLGNTPVEAVYHVLMPSSKNETPKISVGETSYSSVDIDNIKIIGCTTVKKPQNFTFTDGIHEYKWSATDSQLSMKFHNTEIVLEQWPVHYVDDAFAFFESMGQQTKQETAESHSWFLNIEPLSGFNAFMGQPKMSRKNNHREKYIARIMNKYGKSMTSEQYKNVKSKLDDFLLPVWKKDEKDEMLHTRNLLIATIKSINNVELLKKIQHDVHRPMNEFELRIPNSREFHQCYPNFFTDKPILKPNSSSCAGEPKDRSFKLKFMPSGDTITAYVGESGGKAIESLGTQATLGKWILRDVFQLKPYEPLTDKKMVEMGINGVRLTKKNDAIGLSFIWIDPENTPDDLWS